MRKELRKTLWKAKNPKLLRVYSHLPLTMQPMTRSELEFKTESATVAKSLAEKEPEPQPKI